MKYTKFIGLDVHKETIAVAVAGRSRVCTMPKNKHLTDEERHILNVCLKNRFRLSKLLQSLVKAPPPSQGKSAPM